MEYTTKQGKLVMPEYGRNIQQMVEYAVTIEDREERTRCVQSIIASMQNLFPYLREENFKHKLWDHLAIMSDFKLDIDYPFEVCKPESLNIHPEKVPYPDANIRYRHYGKAVEYMAKRINDYEGEEREVLTHRVATLMKKLYIQWNKENVEDQKIFDDLCELSDGKVVITADTMRLFDRRDNQQNNYQHNKQKRNNKQRRKN